jgi:cell division septation protein DedD
MSRSSLSKTVSNERGASSWDLVLKILSITLVSLFAFSSGVWFGKKLSDGDHQRMALEGEFDKEIRKTASTDEHESAADEKDALNDEEVAAAADKALETTRAKSEVVEKAEAVATHGEKEANAGSATEPASTGHAANAAATGAASHGEKAATKMTTAPADVAHVEKPISTRAVASTSASTSASLSAVAASKPDLSAVHQAANRVASNASPVAKEKPATESRVPSSLPKVVGAANDVEFTVQVASYPTADAAKEHVDSMVKKGFPAFPVEATINGKTWYRVSVGSFKSFNDASKFRAQLLKQADLPSAIVQKIIR